MSRRGEIRRLAGLCLLAAVLCAALSACCRESGDIVVCSDVEGMVVSVSVENEQGMEMCQRADGRPLSRGNSFGFDVDVYPVRVTVYDGPDGRGELACVQVETPPPEGARWHVTASQEDGSVQLRVDCQEAHGE